jgi:hypothetical protein
MNSGEILTKPLKILTKPMNSGEILTKPLNELWRDPHQTPSNIVRSSPNPSNSGEILTKTLKPRAVICSLQQGQRHSVIRSCHAGLQSNLHSSNASSGECTKHAADLPQPHCSLTNLPMTCIVSCVMIIMLLLLLHPHDHHVIAAPGAFIPMIIMFLLLLVPSSP